MIDRVHDDALVSCFYVTHVGTEFQQENVTNRKELCAVQLCHRILVFLFPKVSAAQFNLKQRVRPGNPWQGSGARHMPPQKPSMTDQGWEAAQAALEATRQLPVGAERAEALKKAGQLRYDADKNRTPPPDRIKRPSAFGQ